MARGGGLSYQHIFFLIDLPPGILTCVEILYFNRDATHRRKAR
jgi:hypothetical protein